MPSTRSWLLCALSLLLVACGSDEAPIAPREAADDLTAAACDWVEECGQWVVDCAEDGCVAELVAVDRIECEIDRAIDGLDEATCGDLTADEQDLLDECTDGLRARACVTQAEIDAYVAALEAGEQPDDPGEPAPAACDAIADVLLACAETINLAPGGCYCDASCAEEGDCCSDADTCQ